MARQLIIAYVIPRILHGLEALVITGTHMKILEEYYRGMLRDLQALRDKTAKEAMYLLIGFMPIEAELQQGSWGCSKQSADSQRGLPIEGWPQDN